MTDIPEMKVHSDVAWDIASHFSYALASDTRTLAAMIDKALDASQTRLKELALDALVAKGEADENLARVKELEDAHAENARILGFLFSELQGRVEDGKLGALGLCCERSRKALKGGDS